MLKIYGFDLAKFIFLGLGEVDPASDVNLEFLLKSESENYEKDFSVSDSSENPTIEREPVDCTCSTIDDWCNGFDGGIGPGLSECVDGDCADSSWGCGTLLTEGCDGVCAYISE